MTAKPLSAPLCLTVLKPDVPEAAGGVLLGKGLPSQRMLVSSAGEATCDSDPEPSVPVIP